MRKLNPAKRTQILAALVEGSSIASTCRMVGCSKITVLRLLADVGTLCANYHDLYVRGLRTRRVQVDELWAFVGAKQKQVNAGANGVGDVWTWVGIDADTKLIVSYVVGFRDAGYAYHFIKDIQDRVEDKIQLTSDGLKLYVDAVEDVFGGAIDFAQLVKIYGKAPVGPETRYSPPDVIGTCKEAQCGRPDPQHVSTSYVERQNLTVRMSIRRFTRLTNAFSKKIENHEHAVALHYFHYNFCRPHRSLDGQTPAQAAGITNRSLTVADLVDLLEQEEQANHGRLTSYLPAASKSRFSK